MIDWLRQLLKVAAAKTAAAVRTIRDGLAKIWAWVAGHAKALGHAVVEKFRRFKAWVDDRRRERAREELTRRLAELLEELDTTPEAALAMCA
jgi:hypothetical protein